jgi:hypothetical protein
MGILLDAAWLVVAVFKYGSIIVALTGVAIFGFYFVRDNARAARRGENAVPAAAWRGDGPRLGAWLLVTGVVLQLISIVIAAAVPGRF